MTNVNITWQDPTPTQRGREGSWIKVAEELKKNPNRWAIISTKNTRTPVPKAFSGQEWERAYRIVKNNDGSKQFQVFVRFVGSGQ